MRNALPRSGSGFALALTLVYLLIEFALNARILEMMNGDVTSAELRRVEVFGRSLFAFAVCLTLWRALPTAKRSLVALLLVALTLGPMTYWGQKAFVDHLVSQLDPGQRRDAHLATMLAGFIRSGDVRLVDVPFQANDWRSADGAVFLALLPSLAAFSEDFRREIEVALTQALRNRAERDGLDQAQRTWETIQGIHNELRNKYSDYQRSVVIDQRSASAEQGWSAFQERLDRTGVDPLRASNRERERALRWLRDNDLLVSDHFRLYDREAFYTAWQERAERQGYSTDTARPDAPPRGLSYADFVQHSAVAPQLEELIRGAGLPESTSIEDILKAPVRVDHFRNVRMQAREEGDRLVERALVGDAAYAPGGTHDAEGRDAARFTVIPPIALGFSMAGAFMNLGFLAISAFLALRARAGWKTAGGMALVAVGLLLAPYVRPNTLVETPAYREMVSALRVQANPVLVTVIDWTVRLEPTAYAIGEPILASAKAIAGTEL